MEDKSRIRRLKQRLNWALTKADEENFEVGKESRFSMRLQQLCNIDADAILTSLKSILTSSDVNPETFSEILRWASRQEALRVRNIVIDMFIVGLENRSALVRDTAALSLAYFDATAAVAPIRKALESETVPELREDLEHLINSLKA